MSDLLYVHTPDMGEISGFGGDYELECQKMLDAGVKFLNDYPGKELKMGGYQGIVGMVNFDNLHAKNLEKAMLAACADSPTGAMVEAVAKRLFFINIEGWEEYCKQVRAAMGEDTDGYVEIEIEREPTIRQDPPEDINLLDTLKAVFGTQNVFILDSAEAFEELEKRLGINGEPETKQ